MFTAQIYRAIPADIEITDAMRRHYRLWEGKDYWGSLKCYHTTPERRRNCDSEHKPFVRGRRRHLPEPWGNEKPICREKTWKARTKTKRQWLVNKKPHIDTIKNTNFKRIAIDSYIAVEEEIDE